MYYARPLIADRKKSVDNGDRVISGRAKAWWEVLALATFDAWSDRLTVSHSLRPPDEDDR